MGPKIEGYLLPWRSSVNKNFSETLMEFSLLNKDQDMYCFIKSGDFEALHACMHACIDINSAHGKLFWKESPSKLWHSTFIFTERAIDRKHQTQKFRNKSFLQIISASKANAVKRTITKRIRTAGNVDCLQWIKSKRDLYMNVNGS